MKKYIFLIIPIFLLFFITTTCDLYDKSIPEYLDKYTNTATVVGHSITGGMLINLQGFTYPNLIEKDSVITLRLRNPKNFEILTYLDYSIGGGVWEEFTRTEAPDYKNVEFTASPFSGTIEVKHELKDQMQMRITNAEIGEVYSLRLRLKERETIREFEPYIILNLTCTDYPAEIDTNMIAKAGISNYGLDISWQEILKGDLSDANKLVIICQALNITDTYNRTFNGSTWSLWSPEGTSSAITSVGINHSVTIANSALLQNGDTYSVTLIATNEADVVRMASKTLTVAPLVPVTLGTISGVTAPVGGATPVTTITPTAQYTGTVTWAPVNNPFVYATAYTATITLTPVSGFTFNGVGTNFFTVTGATTVTNSANSGVVTAIFPATATPVININTQPAVNTSVGQGAITGSLTIAATVTPSVTLSYQWYSNTANNNTTGTIIAGATNTSYAIPTGLSTGIYYYYCVVSEQGATSVHSNVATVTVKSVTVGNQNGSLNAGTKGGVTFPVTTVNIANGQTGTITWYTTLAGTATTTAATGVTTSTPSVVNNTATLTINSSMLTPSGSYYFRVTIDGIQSNVATFTIGLNTAPGGALSVTDATDLDDIRNNLGGTYRLTGNINLSSYGNWTPIGASSASTRFAGIFDGQGNTISNLNINNPGDNNQGLFGYTDLTSEIKNLGLLNAKVTGSNYVGGVVGYNNGTVENCYVAGTGSKMVGVRGIGGLVGQNYGTVRKCYATSDVESSSSWGGGLVGFIGNDSIVENSYATGNVIGNDTQIGGLFGGCNPNVTVRYCYATGDVSGRGGVGGIVGWFQNANIYVESCVALNKNLFLILPGDTNQNLFGRVAGRYVTGGLITNNARTDMTGPAGTNFGTGVGAAYPDGEDMILTGTGTAYSTVFSGWNTTVWNIPGGNLSTSNRTLPTFRDIPQTPAPTLP
ncbi:MAG: hypothetical protein FWF38_00700 [Spirochaetaceae bacterium]|nr:hypothetical protein [Spirochaetaceae bacterium]